MKRKFFLISNICLISPTIILLTGTSCNKTNIVNVSLDPNGGSWQDPWSEKGTSVVIFENILIGTMWGEIAAQIPELKKAAEWPFEWYRFNGWFWNDSTFSSHKMTDSSIISQENCNVYASWSLI